MSERRWMIDCRHAHRLMSERLDRPLRARERWGLWLHLRMCDWCRRVERQFGFLSRAVKRLGL